MVVWMRGVSPEGVLHGEPELIMATMAAAFVDRAPGLEKKGETLGNQWSMVTRAWCSCGLGKRRIGDGL